MDRRTQTLALSIALIWASGCAAPFGKRGADEKPKSEYAAADTTAPEQTAAEVDEPLYVANDPTRSSADNTRGSAARNDVSPDTDAADDGDYHVSEMPRRAPAVARGNGEPMQRRDTADDPPVDQQSLLDVIAEMEAAGVLDGKARGLLLDDLKQTDPALWPQLLTYFRASLARESRAGQAKPAAYHAPAPLVAESDSADEVVVSDSPETPRPTSRRTAVATDSEPATATVSTAPRNSLAPAPVAAATGVAEAKSSASPLPAAAASGKTSVGNDADWREHLAAAIRGLEQETTAPPDNSAAVGRHAALRLLYLADGRREDAVRPIAGVPPAQQDFWSKELFGLATYLDAERNSETSRRAAEAGVHLQGAAGRLAELATLQVKNLSFCTEVSSFGVYKKFAQYEFQAGQEVLLYAEVENFRSEQTDKGFHTALKASYQILDAHGARVAEHEFKLTEEYCQNARRDYFTNYFVWLPKRIYGGAYTLQLTLEDVKGQKIGQSSVEFTIKEKP